MQCGDLIWSLSVWSGASQWKAWFSWPCTGSWALSSSWRHLMVLDLQTPWSCSRALCQSPASAMFSVGNPGFISFSAGQVEHASSGVVGRCGSTSQWDNGEPRAPAQMQVCHQSCLRHTPFCLSLRVGCDRGLHWLQCSMTLFWKVWGPTWFCSISSCSSVQKYFKNNCLVCFSLWSGTFATDLLSFLLNLASPFLLSSWYDTEPTKQNGCWSEWTLVVTQVLAAEHSWQCSMNYDLMGLDLWKGLPQFRNFAHLLLQLFKTIVLLWTERGNGESKLSDDLDTCLTSYSPLPEALHHTDPIKESQNTWLR